LGYLDRTSKYNEDSRQKVKVSQILRLKKDLALALSAERVRIQAPVPGKSFIGIEVPNKNKAIVRMRSILESEEFNRKDSPLAIALGRDVSGKPLVGDLAKMPHLLIAGSTGSGKSVCITSLTLCLVMNNSPEDLKLVMIDPKMVELIRFNGLPHLIGKVETDLERINTVLRWVVIEMQNRYKSFEEIQARDLDSYNRKVKRRKDYDHLPRIVVMIDELADLMMSARDTTEATLVRLAQMARAVGIHLVVATQRPSTEVVTGLIKANFPARLAFSVFSQTDSRVILDIGGAESLLSRGDMLYLAPEVGIPLRAQGVLTTDQELESVVSYWQNTWQGDRQEVDEAPWEKMIHHDRTSSGEDELIGQAINLIRTSGRVSTSLLQRRLKIGYPRAASLMDEMENMGVVGASRSGGKEREILINLDDEDEMEVDY
jgi:S-DNA-T family DNA segregation ATPase FtsK/SpoIIIE